MFDDIEKCSLCKKEYKEPMYGTKSCHLRHAYILSSRDCRLGKGYFTPRLTVEEFYRLDRGINPICSNRQQCRNRQKRLINTPY